MDWFVCGDFASISCGTWIGFWNGAIGAFVAAVFGGAVALAVVRLTNAQQQRGVDRTIEVAATADFVAAIEELEWAVKYRMAEPGKFDAGSYVLLMRAAVTRLQMARREAEPIAEILLHWPEKMNGLATRYRVARLQDAPYSRDIVIAISQASSAATVNLPSCLARSKVERSVGLTGIKRADSKLTEATDRFDVLLESTTKAASGNAEPRNGGL